MWNNVAEFIQNRRTKRLALALVLSAIVHAFLVSGLNVQLPSPKPEIHTIEARLQALKLVKKVVDNKAIVKDKVAKITEKDAAPLFKNDVSKNEVFAEPDEVLEPLPAEFIPSDLPAATPEPTTPPIQQPDQQEATAAPPETSEVVETEPPTVDEGAVINENAYQYVETDFDVRTKKDGAKEGGAKIVFNLTNGNQYQLTSLIKPDGIAALIVANLLQTSTGQLTKSGLQPSNYVYQYGRKVDKTYTAKFDWPAKKVDLITAKGTKTAEISDGAQDLLSFMYQFMYVAPLERMQISIATGKKLTSYNYSFSGEENINTPLGEIKTIHIFHESEDSDEKTELWLALDYQYVPVKIRKTEKNGKVYELVANRINTSRPAPN